MAGEALTKLASIAMTDEVMEDIGNTVEDVTKRLPFLKYTVATLFCAGWGAYFLWFY